MVGKAGEVIGYRKVEGSHNQKGQKRCQEAEEEKGETYLPAGF